MNDFLKYAERQKLGDKFFEFCSETDATINSTNLLLFLDENEALNRVKCRELINHKEPEPVTDPLTVEGVREIMGINKEQKETLYNIIVSIDCFLSKWGTNGRLIDRDTVINALNMLKDDAAEAIKEGGENGEA